MKKYVVVYRIGGKDNFEWKVTFEALELRRVIGVMNDIKKQGYYCYIAEKSSVDRIGLPDTYEG